MQAVICKWFCPLCLMAGAVTCVHLDLEDFSKILDG